MIIAFDDSKQRTAHRLFQKWRSGNSGGFFINRQSEVQGMIHRSDCTHAGDVLWSKEEEGKSLTSKMKICSASIAELKAWARTNHVSVNVCKHCAPREYQQQPSRTFLVTWKPEKWHWHNLEAQLNEIRRKGFVDEPWTCKTTKVQKGDRVFLLRQGKKLPGIVASGLATSTTHPRLHYAGTGEEMSYVDVRWDTILDADRESILSREVLKQPEFEGMHWDTQSSGISIPPAVAATLEKTWAGFLETKGYSSIAGADEIQTPEQYWDGAVKQVTVNVYERNPKARAACIKHYGTGCSVCEMNFTDAYGKLGKDFIHVHHLRALSSIGKEYEIDPVKDLRPVCPNCHAMLHRTDPPLSIKQLKRIVKRAG